MILGIDPGLSLTGLSILTLQGSPGVVFSGWIRVRVGTLSSKLLQLGDDLQEFLQEHREITSCAVEKVFFARAKPGAIPLAHARGVLLYAVTKVGIPVFEYAPTTIKKTITTCGNATKESVRLALQRVLEVGKSGSGKVPPDVYDALAVAFTHRCSGYQKVHVR